MTFNKINFALSLMINTAFGGGGGLEVSFPGKIQMVQNQSKSHGIFKRGGFPLIMAQDTPNKNNIL